MPQIDEKRYYLHRAEASLDMAHRAAGPMTAAIHMELHRRYLALAGEQSVAVQAPIRIILAR